MTLDELAATLPNGFHDAYLKALAIDYVAREARLLLDIWIGSPRAANEDQREAYREGEVVLTGIVFFVCEPPDARYLHQSEVGLRIDTGAITACANPPSTTLPNVPDGDFVNWIYVTELNAFMYVAARDAQLIWRA